LLLLLLLLPSRIVEGIKIRRRIVHEKLKTRPQPRKKLEDLEVRHFIFGPARILFSCYQEVTRMIRQKTAELGMTPKQYHQHRKAFDFVDKDKVWRLVVSSLL
jgi:hypothetical protein